MASRAPVIELIDKYGAALQASEDNFQRLQIAGHTDRGAPDEAGQASIVIEGRRGNYGLSSPEAIESGGEAEAASVLLTVERAPFCLP